MQRNGEGRLTLMNDKEHFAHIHDQKEVLRLDFQHGFAAEKLLVKMIFPLLRF